METHGNTWKYKWNIWAQDIHIQDLLPRDLKPIKGRTLKPLHSWQLPQVISCPKVTKLWPEVNSINLEHLWTTLEPLRSLEISWVPIITSSLPVHYQFTHLVISHHIWWAIGICTVQRSSFNQSLARPSSLTSSFNICQHENCSKWQ